MVRKASAVWTGDIKGGNGVVSSASGVLKEAPYSFVTRFEDQPGTNPEELVAAAHAACFSMKLSALLGGHNFAPERISTTAELSMDNLEGVWTITKVHLVTRVRAAGIDKETLQLIATDAKTNCPISRLLKAEVSVDADVE